MSDSPNTPRGPHLELRQTQGLVMTPQLQHAISLLQMSNLELAAHLRQEIQSNPFIDMEGATRIHEPDMPGSDSDGDHDSEPSIDGSDAGLIDDVPEAEESWSSYESSHSGGSFDDGEYSIESTLSDSKSLYDHLMEQVAVELDTPEEKVIARALMDGLDESGYFKGDLDESAEKLGAEPKMVGQVLQKMQKFDPSGIFATDLTDCMRIQLEERDRLSEPMQLLLENLDLVKKHNYQKLCKVCNVDEMTLRALLSELRTLDPKPALNFSDGISQTRIPDVLVKRSKDKNAESLWVIQLNPDTLPKVLVNKRYYATIKRDHMNKQEKKYVTDRFNAANWLVKALDERAKSILKVASEIVKQQEAFFLYGVQYLKPLILRDIADAVNLHESTVSRVTTGKYMATSRGVYELKFFFSSSLGSSDGGMEHSGQAVKARIQKLVDDEDPDEILSDDSIVAELEKDGISIARRTVAKYRKALGIGSSVQRRREKKAEKFRA